MISLLLFLLAPSARAEPLTRESAVRETLGGSPTIEKAAAARDEQSWKKTEALGGFLPSVRVTASHLLDKRLEYNDIDFGGSPAHVPLILASNRATLYVDWPVFDGFANVHRYTAASRGAEAAENENDWTRFQLEEEIRLRFDEAIAARDLQAVAEQNVATLAEHLDQVTKTRKGGLATQYDVLRVEVQLNEARSELLRAQDDVVLARQRLAQAMGIDSTNDARELVGELEIPETSGVAALRSGDGGDRKDLRALALRADAADRQSAAAAAFWVPRISLGATYTLYNNLTEGMTDWDRYRAAWNAGVFLTWNLFDGMTSIARSKQANLQRIQAEKSLELAKLAVPNDFEFWKRRYLYSAALYSAKLSDVRKSEESVRLAKAAMRAGVRTNSEVLDAELDLFRARAGLVNSLKSSAEARIRLELAVGRKLPTLSRKSSNAT